MNANNFQVCFIDYQGSLSDGPGIRTVVYLQGCERHCAGCHNPETWARDAGQRYSLDELIQEIVDKSPTKRITFSGGEPLLQKDTLIVLIRLLRAMQFDIAVYTGFTLCDVPHDMLESVDHIKVGNFDVEKKCTTIPYIGSSNQQFITLGNNRNDTKHSNK